MKKLFYCLESKRTKTNWLANLKELYSETFNGKKISVNTQRGSKHKNEFIRSDFGTDDTFPENARKLLSKIIEKAGLNTKNKELTDKEIEEYFDISAVSYGNHSSEYGSIEISLKDKNSELKDFFKTTYNMDFDKYNTVVITNTGTKLIIRKSLSPATLGITDTYTIRKLLNKVEEALNKQNPNLSAFLCNILNQIDENEDNKLPIVENIEALANGKTYLFPITISNTNVNIKLPQVWVDFGEIIGAVYLLKVLELNGAQSVEFPKTSNNPGIDYSIHFKDGNIANISAKAGKGAAASSKDIFGKLKNIISTKNELNVFDKIVNILGDSTIDMPKKLLKILQIINNDAYNYIYTTSGITPEDKKDELVQKLRVKDNNFFKEVCIQLGVTGCADRVLKYDIEAINDINLLSLLFYPIKVAIAKYINHLDKNGNFMPILKYDTRNALTNAINSVIDGYQLSMYHQANENSINLKFALYLRNNADKYRIKPGGYLGDYTLNHFGIELSK